MSKFDHRTNDEYNQYAYDDLDRVIDVDYLINGTPDHDYTGRQRGFECDRQMMTTEPTQLRRGKAFHKKMQADWLKTAQGIVSKEKAIIPFRVINSREWGFKLPL